MLNYPTRHCTRNYPESMTLVG